MNVSLDLQYGTDRHMRIKEAIRARHKLSQRYMSDRHDAWRDSDEQAGAYLKETVANRQRRLNREDSGEPQYTTVLIPYGTALVMTAQTYWSSVYLNRNPVFQFSGRNKASQLKEKAVEAIIDYQMQVGQMLAPLYGWIRDMPHYGLAVIGQYWDKETITISSIEEENETFLGIPVPGKVRKVKRFKTIPGYSGSRLYNVRPYEFFPDPRVPVWQFEKGEFVGRATTSSWNDLIRKQNVAGYMNLEMLKKIKVRGDLYRETGGTNIILPADATENARSWSSIDDIGYFNLLEMYIDLIPNEWGLGTGKQPEKWFFVLAEDELVICARPMGCIHNRFPFFVQEYEIDPYQLTPKSMYEYTTPLNNILTWLFETHLQNVRKVINDQFIVDPSKLVMKDVLDPKAGKLWRLRPEAYGTDPRLAAHQFQVVDVTQSHMKDAEIVMDLMQRYTGVNENMMGLVNPGGRKTATEIRSSNTLGVNRLKTVAEYNAALGWSPLAQVLVQETQQWYDEEQEFRITGTPEKGTIKVTPNEIVGFYDYVPVDGTMPIDRFAMANMMREIMVDVGRIGPAAQGFNFMAWIEEIANIQGLKHFDRFKIQVAPQPLLTQQAAAGNIVPIGGGNGRGGTEGLSGVPGPRQPTGMGPTA